MAAKYKVGYKKPPMHSRFPKGKSGNPRGRPKEAPTVDAVLMKTLRARVTVTENGRRMKMSRMELIIKQLLNKASAGDLPSIQLLLRLHRDGTPADNNGHGGTPYSSTFEDERAEILSLLKEYQAPEEPEDKSD